MSFTSDNYENCRDNLVLTLISPVTRNSRTVESGNYADDSNPDGQTNPDRDLGGTSLGTDS